MTSFTRDKYLGSNIFKGKLVFGKKITPLSGNTGIIFGRLKIMVLLISYNH